ncbi:MAG: DUF2220 family protein, partial [Campylobacterota bacterium]|nr:DUF2220 family protein [Campylobacterota bacterium]
KVKSLFMDESVVTRFKNLSVTTQNSTPFKKLDNLSLSEQKLYHEVQKSQLRLEQERIDFEYISEHLENKPLKCKSSNLDNLIRTPLC